MDWYALRFRDICAIATDAATKTIPSIASAAMVFALVANLYPVPEGVYGKLPYTFLAYPGWCSLLFAFRWRGKSPMQEES
jgi:hypothetical protein